MCKLVALSVTWCLAQHSGCVCMFASNECTVSHTLTPVFIVHCIYCVIMCGIAILTGGHLGYYYTNWAPLVCIPSSSFPPSITLCMLSIKCYIHVHFRGCTIPWRGAGIPPQRNGGRQTTSKAAMFQQEAVSIAHSHLPPNILTLISFS